MTAEDADRTLTEVAEKFSDEEYFEDESESAIEETQSSEEASGENTETANTVQRTQPVQREERQERTSSSSVTTASASTGGRYLIIAGNYLLESNASAMVGRLKREGFATAESAVFDLSQYYTVVAGRYTSREEANRQSKNLKSLGVDNYVLTKK
jgi:septal ring-binding cell division protein DamX